MHTIMGLLAISLWAIIPAFIVVFFVNNLRSRERRLGKLAFAVAVIAVCLLISLFYFYGSSAMQPALSEDASGSDSHSWETQVSPLDAEKIRNNTPKLRAIIQSVIAGKPVDEQLYDHFWSLLPGSIRQSPELRSSFAAGIKNGLSSQRPFWQSMLQSAERHHVVETANYIDAQKRHPYENPTDAELAKEMLKAAASGKPLQLKNGSTLELGVDAAKKALARLDESEDRLDKLFAPAWQP